MDMEGEEDEERRRCKCTGTFRLAVRHQVPALGHDVFFISKFLFLLLLLAVGYLYNQVRAHHDVCKRPGASLIGGTCEQVCRAPSKEAQPLRHCRLRY